jgi:hypothetical protein
MKWRAERMNGAFMPLQTFDQPLRLEAPIESRAFGLTYIKAAGDLQAGEARGGPFWKTAERVSKDPRWRYFEIATTHNVQLTAPEALAELLLSLARPD